MTSTIKRLALCGLLVAVCAVGCTKTIDHKKILISEKLQMTGWSEDHPGQALYRLEVDDEIQFWASDTLFKIGDTLELVRWRNGN